MAGEHNKAGWLGRRGAALAATLAAPALLYLIVLTAAPAIAPAAGLTMAPLPPQDPTPLLRQLIRAVQNPKIKVAPAIVASAKAALASAPLAYEPFFIAAQQAEQAGQFPLALRLTEEARRRRPTFAPIRLKLSLYYMQRQRYAEALAELDIVIRRNESLRKQVLPELVRLVGDAQGREALSTVLAKEPEWHAEFLDYAAGGKLSTEDARDLYRRVAAKKRSGSLALERQLIFQTQASSGDYDGARRTWLQGLPAEERNRGALLFDGEFRGLKAPKPFGWVYFDKSQGRAEPARDGNRSYLEVAYFGGSDALLAEQVLALRPGRYRLRHQVRVDSPGTGASERVSWRLTCLPGEAGLAKLAVPDAAGSTSALAVSFEVPSTGCPGQKLSLIGEPGEVASSVNLQILKLEVTR